MKRILLVLVVLITTLNAFSQQNVFSRSDAGTGDWGSGNLPWFYQTSNNNQGDPDNNNTVRNDVFIGHNNNTTMSVNGRTYIHRDFTFQAGATNVRTINAASGVFSFSRSLINSSSASHIFNTPVSIDASNAEIVVNTSGSLIFNGAISTNGNLTFVRGIGTVTFTGAVNQVGSFVKQGTGTFVISGSANVLGNLFIDEGILRADRNLGTGSLEIGAGIQGSTGFNAIFEINSGSFGKNITVKNFGTGAGNRSIRFTNTSGQPNISSTFVLEKTVEISSIANGSINGIIGGIGGITKIGVGNLELGAASTFTGLTTVNAGTLQLNRIGGGTLPSTNDVIVNSGATLRISRNQILGQITLNGGTLLVDAGVELIVNSITTTSNATITGAGLVKLIDVLTVSASSNLTTTSGNLILRSTNTSTARVAAVGAGGSIVGDVTVERYLQGRRAVRFLTPAVTTTSTIFNNWQNGGNFVAGIGTHITGSTTIANGFDVTTTGNPSLFTYNAQVATGTGFTAISNTDVNVLTAGVGYRLLVRGDRTPENITTASQDNMNVPTTLSATGALTVGSVTYTSAVGPALVNNQAGNTQTNGYTLIGNPYASPVDWHSISKNNVAGNAYYTWDPTLGTPAQRGRYVVYSQLGGASLFDDSSAQPLNNRQFLQVGQAFFIKNEPGQSATLVFDETNKASTYQYVYRNSQAALTSNNSSLYLSVYDPNELALGGNAIDGAAAVFGTDYATTLDNNDVEKLVASGENVAFVRENKNLAIETVAPVQANDVLFVKTIAFQANKNYTFKVNTTNFNTTVAAKMVDMYLNTETAIDLTQPSFVTFSTTADAASFGSDRFKIVFNSAALGNDNFTRNTIAVYPNPIVNNEFTVAMPSSVTGKVTLTITNMLGQQVYKTTTEATPTMQIQPMQKLQEGIYVVSVNSNGNVTQAKVTVKN